MNKIKKSAFIVLMMLLCFTSFTACGNKKASSTDNTIKTTKATSASTQAASTASSTSTYGSVEAIQSKVTSVSPYTLTAEEASKLILGFYKLYFDGVNLRYEGTEKQGNFILIDMDVVYDSKDTTKDDTIELINEDNQVVGMSCKNYKISETERLVTFVLRSDCTDYTKLKTFHCNSMNEEQLFPKDNKGVLNSTSDMDKVSASVGYKTYSIDTITDGSDSFNPEDLYKKSGSDKMSADANAIIFKIGDDYFLWNNNHDDTSRDNSKYQKSYGIIIRPVDLSKDITIDTSNIQYFASIESKDDNVENVSKYITGVNVKKNNYQYFIDIEMEFDSMDAFEHVEKVHDDSVVLNFESTLGFYFNNTTVVMRRNSYRTATGKTIGMVVNKPSKEIKLYK